MNKRIRVTLLITAFLSFIIITPLVILYAMGYRPDGNSASAQPVGVLLVDSIPDNAGVTVQGSYRGDTPQAVPNLEPGDVRVTVEQEGYEPWEKTIQIQPARATEVRHIRLFPEQIPTERILQNTERFSLSPNRALLAIIDSEDKLRIQRQSGEQLINPIQFDEPPKMLLWSPDNSYVLVQSPSADVHIIDFTSTTTVRQRLQPLQNARNITWDPRVPGRILATTPRDTLIAVNVNGQRVQTIDQHVTTFAPSSRYLYVAQTDGTLHEYTLEGVRIDTLSTEDIDHDVQSLHVTPGGNIAVLTPNGATYVREEGSDVFTQITAAAKRAVWSPDGRVLLTHTKHNELYVYNVDNERLYNVPVKKNHLIVRLSRPISHAQWFAGGQHIVYQVNDEIRITEIDTRDYPVTRTIDTTNIGNAQATVGEDGEIMYYIKKEGSTQTLMQAALLVE